MKKILILLVLAFASMYLCNTNEHIDIPYTSIRLRVVANSNSKEDQKYKLLIKEVLEKQLSSLFENKNSYENLDNTIIKNKENITNIIEKTMMDNNIQMDYSYNYGLNFFPEKEYKGIKYPSGNYNSIVVKLGEAKGDNFWCVLFPPLCLIDENVEDYEYQSLIKEVIKKYN